MNPTLTGWLRALTVLAIGVALGVGLAYSPLGDPPTTTTHHTRRNP